MELAKYSDNGAQISKIGWDSIEEQNITLNRLLDLESRTPISQRSFFSRSEYMAGFLNFSVSILCWRSSFRGFNLRKYDKHRTPSMVLTTISSFNGAVIYSMMTKQYITGYFRKENMYYYGFLSVCSHNLSLLFSVPTAIFFTFMLAQRHGMILVPDNFTSRKNRPLVLKELKTRLRPYAKSVLIVYTLSNLAMFYVGCRAYNESKHLLHLLGRKTLSMKEVPTSNS